ncbi:MAG: glutamate-cysteine ligase family protein, partial [Legionellaceae bacterium]
MSKYPIFSVMGIEIEYMLVDSTDLCVQPKSDVLLKALAGEMVNETILGDIAISNELVMHVLELKNNGPKTPTAPIAQHFQEAIMALQPLLHEHHLMLLPTAAHPFMNPQTQTKRWPHGNMDIYALYDRIFNCQGHGWSNLQSMHVNLPFLGDDEFSTLHNNIRLLLPLLPALAASSPILDGAPTGMLDTRLSFYDKNQASIPSISGDIIPEAIHSKAEYESTILTPMYEAIRPFDPEHILQEEWLNSRAAIPKFEYGAIEIRIIDSQECVNADIAIAHLIHAILKHWTTQQPSEGRSYELSTRSLKAIYDKTLHTGLDVLIQDVAFLKACELPP